MPRAKAVKPARKKSAVLTKAVKPAKKELVKEQRQILSGLRATLRGYKADRIEASKTVRLAAKAEIAAGKIVAKQEAAIMKVAAKIVKLAA
jgi:hypothetical protein